MRRRNVVNLKQQPVMSAAHGGTVHHGGWDWVMAHKLLVETLVLIGGVVALIVMVYLFQVNPFNAQPATLRLTEAEYQALHSYDAIEAARAARLINPVRAVDQSYDALETMRAQRLIAQGDHGYDAIENLRASALINPMPTADHSYDAIEEIRANRSVNK